MVLSGQGWRCDSFRCQHEKKERTVEGVQGCQVWGPQDRGAWDLHSGLGLPRAAVGWSFGQFSVPGA